MWRTAAVRYIIQVLILAILIVLVLRYGGWPERCGAAIMALMFAVSPAYVELFAQSGRLDRIDPGFFVIDIALFALMLGLALASDRWWPLWMAGAQLIAVLSHFVRLLENAYAPLAYALMMRAPSWIELGILAIGIWLASHRPARSLRD